MLAWGQIDGRLTLNGAPGFLSPDMNLQAALNVAYVHWTEWMNKEDREELEGWLSVTWDQVPAATDADRQRKLDNVLAWGGELA